VGVDHGGLDVLVAEEFLNGADVVAVLEEVGGEGVAKGVGGDVFLDPGLEGGGADGFLKQGGVGVVAHGLFGVGVDGEGQGGEEVLPGGFAGGVGVFAGEGIGEPDLAESISQVGLVDALDGFDLPAQVGDEGGGQDGGAVVFAFSVADEDLAVAEVDVFDAQAHTFHQAQAAAVEELGHELGRTAHFGDDEHGFLVGEDNGQGFGFFGADEVGGDLDLFLKDLAVEEEDGAEGLVLGGGGYVLFDGEVGDEGLDLFGAHVFGVALVVEEDEALDPFLVGLFGAAGVVFGADGVADLVHEFAGWGCGRVHLIDRFGGQVV